MRGTEVGPAADVYALGLVLLECLTGRRECPGGDVEAAVARPRRPPAVPSDLVHLLSLMTSGERDRIESRFGRVHWALRG